MKKEDFVREVGVLMDAVDKESRFADAFMEYSGNDAVVVNVHEVCVLAMKHIILGKWCRNPETAREEAEWFVTETDFGRKRLPPDEGPYTIKVERPGCNPARFEIRDAASYHEYLEYHYLGRTAEKRLTIVVHDNGERRELDARKLWSWYGERVIEPYVEERIARMERDGVNYSDLREIYERIGEDVDFELASETPTSVKVHWTEDDWYAEFILK